MHVCMYLLPPKVGGDFFESFQKARFKIFDEYYVKIKMCFLENSAVFINSYWKTFFVCFYSLKCNNLTLPSKWKQIINV